MNPPRHPSKKKTTPVDTLAISLAE